MKPICSVTRSVWAVLIALTLSAFTLNLVAQDSLYIGSPIQEVHLDWSATGPINTLPDYFFMANDSIDIETFNLALIGILNLFDSQYYTEVLKPVYNDNGELIYYWAEQVPINQAPTTKMFKEWWYEQLRNRIIIKSNQKK